MSLTTGFEQILANDNNSLSEQFIEVELNLLEDMASEIPFISTVISLAKFTSNFKKKHEMEKLYQFLKEITADNAKQETCHERKQRFIDDERIREKELEYLIIILDRYLELDKATYLARFYLAYLDKDITWNQLTLFASIIDKLLLCDFSTLIHNIQIEIFNDEINDSVLRLVSLGLMFEKHNQSYLKARENGNLGLNAESLKNITSKKRIFVRTNFANKFLQVISRTQ